jgi:hypothetical protein
MLIDRLNPAHLLKLDLEIKLDYPTTYEAILKSLRNTEYVSDMPYGTFMLMREHFGEQHSAYDYFI